MPQLVTKKELDEVLAQVGTGGGGTGGHWARRFKASEQTIGSANTAVQVTMSQSEAVQGTDVEVVTNGLRARVDGIYIIAASAWVSNTTTGYKNFLLQIDGAAAREFPVDTAPGRGPFADVFYLTAGQTATLAAYVQTAGVVVKGGSTKDTGITMARLVSGGGTTTGGTGGGTGVDVDHRANFSNPHQVTKTQVGLSNVTNHQQVRTTSTNMTLDYGTTLPPAGQAGRFFFLVTP